MKDPADKSKYNIGYRAGWRAATIQHLGGRCQWIDPVTGTQCEQVDPKILEIHHIGKEGVCKKDAGR